MQLGHRRLNRTAADVARWEAGDPLTAREMQGLARVVGESSRYLETGEEDTGTRIARQRARVGLEQADLAERMDVAVRNVQFWEQGRNVMRKHLPRLARVLQTTPEYLLFGTEAVPAQNGNGNGNGDESADETDEDRRGGMRGFDEVARRIDDLRGPDPDATLSELRADVQRLEAQVEQIVLAWAELSRRLEGPERSGTAGQPGKTPAAKRTPKAGA